MFAIWKSRAPKEVWENNDKKADTEDESVEFVGPGHGGAFKNYRSGDSFD